MKLRGKELSANLVQDYKDKCKFHHKTNYKEQFNWNLKQINSLTDKQWKALQGYYNREIKRSNLSLEWNLVYNPDSFYVWLKAVTGKSEPTIEKFKKAYNQDEFPFKLDKQSKIDLGLKVTHDKAVKKVVKKVAKPMAVKKEVVIGTKDDLLAQIDAKIKRHQKTKNKGALAGWMRMKDYLTTGKGDYKELQKEVKRKKHNNPRLWNMVEMALLAYYIKHGCKSKAKPKPKPKAKPDTKYKVTKKPAALADLAPKPKVIKPVAEKMQKPLSEITRVKNFEKFWKERSLKSYVSDGVKWYQWQQYKKMPWYDPKIRLINLDKRTNNKRTPIYVAGYISPYTAAEIHDGGIKNLMTQVHQKPDNPRKKIAPFSFVFDRDWYFKEGKLWFRDKGEDVVMPNPMRIKYLSLQKIRIKVLEDAEGFWMWRITWKGERYYPVVQILWAEKKMYYWKEKEYSWKEYLKRIDKQNKLGLYFGHGL